jgi:co-chaperonin GroES (HSP10)
MPDFSETSDEPWRTTGREQARFIPMQARPGDYALFFRKAAVEITFENETYLVVPQSALLALVRE